MTHSAPNPAFKPVPHEAPQPALHRSARFAGYAPAAHSESVHANRTFWDADAANYLAEHGQDLGEAEFQWCPEGLQEKDANLLGLAYPNTDPDLRVLEIGAGAAQCSRWLAQQHVSVIATDLSHAMLNAAKHLDTRHATHLPLIQCDGGTLPFAPETFDVVFSAYGVFPFVADITSVLRDIHRVLRTRGKLVFSVTHPIRWAFPDDPSAHGLTANRSYFDPAPYIETDPNGNLNYAEHHRTLGDYVRAITASGLTLTNLVEPTWPDERDTTWGGWSRLRGEKLPGTAIFSCSK